MLTLDERREIRQHYVVEQPRQMSLMAATVGTKYANGYYLLDVSSYQAKADKTTNVDWDTIAKVAPWIIGGYCKLGEVADTIYSKNEDDFLDLSFKTNVEGMRRNHMLCGAYVYLNTGLFSSQMGMGLADYENWKRPTERDTLANVVWDPQLHLILRQLKIGFGRSPNLGEIKAMPTRDIHFIVLDVEKYKVFYGNVNDKFVSDYEIGLNARVTKEKLQWLMDNHYLPQMPILLYSGAWFVDNYGNVNLRAVADQMDTICAGYYWGMTYTPTTFAKIRNDFLPQIPDTWHPPLFGGAEKFGKKVMFYQITGDKFAVPEILNDNNQPSAIDLNYCNFTSLEEITEAFPLWTDFDQLGTIVTPPTPPITKKFFSSKYATTNMRNNPSVVSSETVAHPVAGKSMEVIEEIDAEGYHWIATKVWTAVTSYITITEES